MHCVNGECPYSGYLTTIKGIGYPSPSAAAKSGRYVELQADPDTTIYDGFYNINNPANTSALPIEVYHPVFKWFTENITTTKPSKELLVEVQKLMAISTGVGTVETSLAKNLRSALTNILGKYMGQAVVDGAIASGMIQKVGERWAIPLLMMEHKQAVGEGGYDPMTQGSHSALNYWRDNAVSTVGF